MENTSKPDDFAMFTESKLTNNTNFYVPLSESKLYDSKCDFNPLQLSESKLDKSIPAEKTIIDNRPIKSKGFYTIPEIEENELYSESQLIEMQDSSSMSKENTAAALKLSNSSTVEGKS